MSITDELMEWMDRTTTRFDGRRYLLGTDEELTAIADRIDAEHQKAEDEWRAKNGDMWLKGYNVCHKELMEGNPVIVADLENAGWVRLPVDADGVPIRVGDVLTDDAEFKSEGKVIRLMLEDESWSVGLECGGWTNPSIHEWHHYHEPTVEDVLRDMHAELDEVTALYVGEAIDSDERDRDEARIFAEYAKRLTLAGDAE